MAPPGARLRSGCEGGVFILGGLLMALAALSAGGAVLVSLRAEESG